MCLCQCYVKRNVVSLNTRRHCAECVTSQESLLNGRIEPCGAVEGFAVDIGASGSFCPKHITLPVQAFFFKLSEDNAPSPYLVSTVPPHPTKTVIRVNQSRTCTWIFCMESAWLR